MANVTLPTSVASSSTTPFSESEASSSSSASASSSAAPVSTAASSPLGYRDVIASVIGDIPLDLISQLPILTIGEKFTVNMGHVLMGAKAIDVLSGGRIARLVPKPSNLGSMATGLGIISSVAMGVIAHKNEDKMMERLAIVSAGATTLGAVIGHGANIAEYRRQNEVYRGQLSRAEQQLGELREQVLTLRGANETLKDLHGSLAELVQEKGQLLKELQGLKEEKGKAQSEMRDAIAEKKVVLGKMDEQIEDKQAEIKTLTSTISQLNERIESLEAQVQTAQQAIENQEDQSDSRNLSEEETVAGMRDEAMTSHSLFDGSVNEGVFESAEDVDESLAAFSDSDEDI